MTRIPNDSAAVPRLRRTAAAAVLAGVTGLAALTGPPAALAAGAHQHGGAAVTAVRLSAGSTPSLVDAYAKGRQIPAGSIAGIRRGTAHVARVAATGAEWAVASFDSTKVVPGRYQAGFEDGAGTGIFTRAKPGEPWRLVSAGQQPLVCDGVIPASVRAALQQHTSVACAPASADHATPGAAPSALAERIAKLALTQVGVSDQPSNTDFAVDCDPYTTMDGPSYPNSNTRGCGFSKRFDVADENEEWCSDFADWIWRRAGVTADMDLISPGANSFYAWGKAQGQPLTVDGTDPQVGDAVTFYQPGAITTATSADHVGLITKVNSNGTIDMVNGDFAGNSNTSVQYNTDISLASWSAAVWGTGEQWVFVAPPTAPQPATPTIRVAGPHVVAGDASTTFRVSGTIRGAKIDSYVWSFGDGEYVPGGSVTGKVVHHVFADPGRTTVTVYAKSSLGTIAVKTWNVNVVTGSGAAASTPSDALYYSYTPVETRLFSVSSRGILSSETWDGASWLDERLPAGWTAGGALASLDYKNAQDALTPHVFGRSRSGQLQEAYLDAMNWRTRQIAARPRAGSPIVATTVLTRGRSAAAGSAASQVAVFFFNRAGELSQSDGRSGAWKTTVVPYTRGDRGLALASTVDAGNQQIWIWTVSAHHQLMVLRLRNGHWSRQAVTRRGQVAAGSHLTATGPAGGAGPRVFYVDRQLRLAEATPNPRATAWKTQVIGPQAVRAASGLESSDYVSSGGELVPEVISISRAEVPQLSTDTASGWRTTALPGTASKLDGLAAYAIPGGPQTLFTSDGSVLGAESSQAAMASWTVSVLPAKLASFKDRVVLYAADSADYSSAVAAAAAAGLPATQVTGNFSAAWADALSGDYLVITVGGPAATALYYNACGWTNPSDAFGGSTPFTYVVGPVHALPGANVFELANGADSTSTAQLASDLAYYAVHDALPAGQTSLPTQLAPPAACAGSAS